MFRSCEFQVLAVFILLEYFIVHSAQFTNETSKTIWLDLKVNQIDLSAEKVLPNIIQSMLNRENSSALIHHVEPRSTVTIDCITLYTNGGEQEVTMKTGQAFNSQRNPNVHLTCPLSRHVCFSNCSPMDENLTDIQCKYLSIYQKSTNVDRVFRKFPYEKINIFRYTFHELSDKFNGTWTCHSDGQSSELHDLIVSDSAFVKKLSPDRRTVTVDIPVNVTCSIISFINTTDITNLNSDNKNIAALDDAHSKLQFTVQYTGMKTNDSITRTNVCETEWDTYAEGSANIECQVTDEHRHRVKRRVNSDFHYPSKSVRLDTNLSPDHSVEVGTVLEIKCTAEPGNPPPKLSLLRQRFEETKATVIQTKTRQIGQTNSHMKMRKEVVQEFVVTLSEEDNGASFFCEVTSTGITSSVARSDSVRYNVSFPPRAVYVQSFPEGLIPESTQKTFMCQTDSMGSNPPAILKWQQLDSAGAVISLESLKMSIQVDFNKQTNGAVVTRSNLTVLATRALNGRRFECSVVFNDSKTMLRSEGFLEVMFSPNNIRLTAQPINGVPEASRLELTCSTSSCHPPAVIRWLEIPPDKIKEKNKNTEELFQRINLFSNELTDLAQLETKQGDFGGTKVSSTLIITKTYRSQQNTIFQCLVNHTGMNKPVLTEHRLQILYPPSIHIISLPNQPVTRQSVSLFCQTIGGNPLNNLKYAWFVGKSTQFSSLLNQKDDVKRLKDNSNDQMITNNSPSLSTPPNHFLSPPLHTLQKPEFPSMIQLTGYHDSSLNLTNIKLSQAGWYGCEVSGVGGSSHALHYLDLYYQPIMNRRTQTHIMAQVGESVTLALYVDANPPWAEAEWFQIDTYKNEVRQINGPQQYIESQAYFESPYNNDGYPYSYESWPRVKRATYHRPESRSADFSVGRNTRQSIGQKGGQRKNIFASRGTGLNGNLTFLLRFTEVKPDDFGTYICQVRHQLGVKEFTFYLIKKSGAGVITEDSIEIIHHGSTTSILFNPPMKSSFTRLILRVCRRDAYIANPLHLDKSPVSKQHVRQDVQYQKRVKRTVNSGNTTNQNDLNRLDNTQQMISSRSVGCEDYHVAKPWLGKMEVHLSDAIQLYNFRFLLFQGTKLLQETSPILWQPEIAKDRGVFSKSLLALAVTGGCALVIVFLITAIIFYSCYGRKKRSSLQFWNIKKSPKSSTSHLSNKKVDVRNPTGSELGFELHSDIGSVRRYQPEIPYKQSVKNGSFISHGYENSLNGTQHFSALQASSGMNIGFDGNSSIDNECAALLHSRNSVASSSQSAHMNLINSRIFAEAYAAAARAAASVVSGSTEIYSPSTQMTNDLSTHTNEDRHKSQNSLITYPMNSDMPNELMVTSKETNMSSENGGDSKKSNNVNNASLYSKNRDKIKVGQFNKFKQSFQGSRKSSRLSLSGQPAEPRGSHLSVHMPSSKHPSNYSQWSNASGTSYSSLVSPSQTDLQVTAQVAAAAAIASVVENMSFGLAMNHASSLNNVGGFCLLPRPSSRAASVTGPPGRCRPGNGSEDGESMKYAIFTPRNTSTGQATPTASVDTIDPNLQISTPSPVSQQQNQYPTDSDNPKNQLQLDNQHMSANITSQFNGAAPTRYDDRYNLNYNQNRLIEPHNIGNPYQHHNQHHHQQYYSPNQQQLYAVHGIRGPYSTFINPMNTTVTATATASSSSPSPILNVPEQNASLMAYYRILAQNQMLNRHKLQQFHQHQLIQQQQQHQRQHQQYQQLNQNRNDQLKSMINANKIQQQQQQQTNLSKNSSPTSDQADHHKNNPEQQQIDLKLTQETEAIDRKTTNQTTDKHTDESNSGKPILVMSNSQYDGNTVNKNHQKSSSQTSELHIAVSQSQVMSINESEKSIKTEMNDKNLTIALLEDGDYLKNNVIYLRYTFRTI
uniref:Ig-like domain-containing protein n=1 Tax=Trichobilharzia regenti TaxID=157069 RepID=A0AA85KL11_TRIRE|nr:unnamed protein product [Trichobilharzia regenti]